MKGWRVKDKIKDKKKKKESSKRISKENQRNKFDDEIGIEDTSKKGRIITERLPF